MEMTIKKRIGKETYTFIVTGKNLFELVSESQKLSFNDVDKCGCCGADELYLNTRIAKDKYKYTEVKCKKCHATLTFGQTQENPDVFYLRKNDDKELKWAVYTKTAEK